MDGVRRIEHLREIISKFPKSPGLYFMKDAQGVVLYIGKAKDLRSRVHSYFQDSTDLLNTRGPEIARMATKVCDIDFMECETEVDALLQENRLIKDVQPPFNADLKDGRSFPYLEITTREDFPGVYVTRQPHVRGSKLYGPFVNAFGLREAVDALQRIFKFRTCGLDIRDEDESRRYFRPCLLYSIHRCTAPCAANISREDYRKDIGRLRKLLGSKRRPLLRQLKNEMDAASKEHRYEEAAVLRDRIGAIESLSLSGSPDDNVQPEVFFVDPREGLERLGKILELENPLRSIECIDIAHLQGDESVGALVCFIDGRPYKSGYKRFRIKTVEGQDDYAMIREVLLRRYRYAAGGEELYPDLILIDGGLGHLHAALNAFSDLIVRPPMVLALAKKKEELFIQARSKPLILPRNDPALRLLQHARDEAHRFAQNYHHLLRSKKLFQDDVPSK